MTTIQNIENICQHRIVNMHESGKWTVWDVTVSGKTFDKFVCRVRGIDHITLFSRDDVFGVLTEELEVA